MTIRGDRQNRRRQAGRYVDLARYLARCALRAGLVALVLMAALYGLGAALALHPHSQTPASSSALHPHSRTPASSSSDQALQYWIAHTPACLGPACIDVFDDEVQIAWHWRAPAW